MRAIYTSQKAYHIIFRYAKHSIYNNFYRLLFLFFLLQIKILDMLYLDSYSRTWAYYGIFPLFLKARPSLPEIPYSDSDLLPDSCLPCWTSSSAAPYAYVLFPPAWQRAPALSLYAFVLFPPAKLQAVLLLPVPLRCASALPVLPQAVLSRPALLLAAPFPPVLLLTVLFLPALQQDALFPPALRQGAPVLPVK